jgi:hypothetical protein
LKTGGSKSLNVLIASLVNWGRVEPDIIFEISVV